MRAVKCHVELNTVRVAVAQSLQTAATIDVEPEFSPAEVECLGDVEPALLSAEVSVMDIESQELSEVRFDLFFALLSKNVRGSSVLCCCLQIAPAELEACWPHFFFQSVSR